MFAGIYLKLIAAAIIVAAVVGGYMYVRHLQDSVARLETENLVLGSKIKEQNDAVDAMKADEQARMKAAAAAIASAKAETKRAQGKATVIYKTIPSTPGDDCRSALDLINGTMQVEAEKVEKKALELINGSKK